MLFFLVLSEGWIGVIGWGVEIGVLGWVWVWDKIVVFLVVFIFVILVIVVLEVEFV